MLPHFKMCQLIELQINVREYSTHGVWVNRNVQSANGSKPLMLVCRISCLLLVGKHCIANSQNHPPKPMATSKQARIVGKVEWQEQGKVQWPGPIVQKEKKKLTREGKRILRVTHKNTHIYNGNKVRELMWNHIWIVWGSTGDFRL